jgi:hypothetical protein
MCVQKFVKYNFLKKAIKISRVGDDLSSYAKDKFNINKIKVGS